MKSFATQFGCATLLAWLFTLPVQAATLRICNLGSVDVDFARVEGSHGVFPSAIQNVEGFFQVPAGRCFREFANPGTFWSLAFFAHDASGRPTPIELTIPGAAFRAWTPKALCGPDVRTNARPFRYRIAMQPRALGQACRGATPVSYPVSGTYLADRNVTLNISVSLSQVNLAAERFYGDADPEPIEPQREEPQPEQPRPPTDREVTESLIDLLRESGEALEARIRQTTDRCDSFCEDHDVGYPSVATEFCTSHQEDEGSLADRLQRAAAIEARLVDDLTSTDCTVQQDGQSVCFAVFDDMLQEFAGLDRILTSLDPEDYEPRDPDSGFRWPWQSPKEPACTARAAPPPPVIVPRGGLTTGASSDR